MILQELKRRTQAQHERVESRLPLLRDDLSLAEYRALLARFHGFYVPVEERLCTVEGWERVGLSPADRLKTPLLRRDLGLLGVDPSAVPLCPTPPDLPTLPRALGCMYVLEGATLGGQLIRRQLERSLALTPDRGAAFFTSYGERVGPMWKAFGAALTAYAELHPATDEIVAAACDTFTRLDAWLTGEGGVAHPAPAAGGDADGAGRQGGTGGRDGMGQPT